MRLHISAKFTGFEVVEGKQAVNMLNRVLRSYAGACGFRPVRIHRHVQLSTRSQYYNCFPSQAQYDHWKASTISQAVTYILCETGRHVYDSAPSHILVLPLNLAEPNLPQAYFSDKTLIIPTLQTNTPPSLAHYDTTP